MSLIILIVSVFIYSSLFMPTILSSMIIEINKIRYTNTLKRFVSNYRNHSFIIHLDSPTKIDIDSILKILPTFQIVSDQNNSLQPASKNTVNIFFIQNSSDSISNRSHSSVYNQDGCNLFLTFNVTQEICELESVKLASASFIFDVGYNHLFSCFTENEDFRLASVRDNQLDSLIVFHKSHQDLLGKVLKVYFVNNRAIRCRKLIGDGLFAPVESGSCSPIGPEAELIRTIGQTMNFVPEFKLYEHKNVYTVWNEMLNAISRGEADLGAGSLFLSNDGLVHYTSFICSSAPYGTFFVNPTKQFNLGVILNTFDIIVYLFALFTLTLIIILTAAFLYFFNYQYGKNDCTFTLIRIILEQGSNLNRRLYHFNTMRVILSLWLILNIIFSTAVKSKVSSTLIKPETYDFKSVEDIIQNGFSFTIAPRFRKMFLHKYGSHNIKIMDLQRGNYENKKQICPGTDIYFQRRHAVVNGEFNLVLMNRICKKTYPVDKMKDQVFLLESSIYYALAVTPSSPYKKQLTKIINLLKASGIMNYWFKNMYFEYLGDYNKQIALPKPFEIKQIYNFFVLLLVGLGIGLIVLVFEMFEADLNRKRKITKTKHK